MDRSMPGFPVLHHLPEFIQTHVHWVGDAIQPSHPLSSPSPPAFNLSQHQSLFQWVSSLHHVVKVSGLQLQHQSFQWIFRVHFLLDWLVWFPCCPRVSQESSLAPQFESISSSASINDYWKNHSFDYMDLWGKVMSLLFNMLSKFVIAFLPRSKPLLISWLNHHPQWFWSPRK